MSIIGAKWFPQVGWVGVKNIDTDLKPTVLLRKSYRRGVERTYLWETGTRYTEGINEFGIGILHIQSEAIEDETEGTEHIEQDDSIEVEDRTYYAPDGLRIRKALYESTVEAVVNKLVELEITGNLIIFDAMKCMVLEGAFTQDESGDDVYAYKTSLVPEESVVARSGVGVLLPWTGPSEETEEDKRRSEEIRYRRAINALQTATTHDDLLDLFSATHEDDSSLLKLSTRKGSSRTAGQILIVSQERTLHFRPVWCNLGFRMEKFNGKGDKTFFEIVSARKLLSVTDIASRNAYNTIMKGV